MINNTFPKPAELIQREIKTLEFFGSKQLIPQLCQDAQRIYLQHSKLPNHIRRRKNQSVLFSFDSHFDISINNDPNFRIYLGMKINIINGDYENISYRLLIAKKHDRSNKDEVFRKFRFDYNPQANVSEHPFFHIQYGGQLTPSLETRCTNCDQFPNIDLPRIPYKPISLALLIQLIFMNFADENTEKTKNDNTWKNIVRDNEQLCWGNYYKNCHTYLNSSDSGLLYDYCCGK